jgi:hypothetical protein
MAPDRAAAVLPRPASGDRTRGGVLSSAAARPSFLKLEILDEIIVVPTLLGVARGEFPGGSEFEAAGLGRA